MILNRIVSYFAGYVEVLARGAQLEKLINLLTNSGLFLWDIQRLGPDVIRFKIRAHGFLQLHKQVLKRTKVTVKICRKRGWPFVWRRLKTRRFFLIGAVLFIALLIYSSSLILVIKVDGFEGGQREKLLQTLKGIGLKPGLSRSDLLRSKRMMEREVMLVTPTAVWLGISVHGVVAEVRVIPRKVAPNQANGYDLVAGADGVITKLVVIRGTPVVKEGETVARGDLLISGQIWYKNLQSDELIAEDVPPVGTVEARVWDDLEILEPKVVWKIAHQQAAATEYSLRWGQKMLSLGKFGQKPRGNYSRIRWHKVIFKGRNPIVIVELIKDIWQETIWHKRVRSSTELKQAALREAALKSKYLALSSEKLNQLETWSDEGNFIKLAVTVETIRDIAVVSPRRKEH